MVDAETVARQYIELWNETVPQRRAQLLATQWDENATYTDPMARGSGLQAIDALIRDVHARFSGYRSKLITPGRSFSEFVRFSWSLGAIAWRGADRGK